MNQSKCRSDKCRRIASHVLTIDASYVGSDYRRVESTANVPVCNKHIEFPTVQTVLKVTAL